MIRQYGVAANALLSGQDLFRHGKAVTEEVVSHMESVVTLCHGPAGTPALLLFG